MIQMIIMLFLKIVEMSLTAGIVILVVLFVRLFLRRLPKRFAYTLWLVAAFRLIVPITAASNISIFNMFVVEGISSELSGISDDKVVETENTAENGNVIDGKLTDNVSGQAMQGYVQNSVAIVEANTENVKNTSSVKNSGFVSIMAFAWIAGIVTLVSYTVTAYIRIRRKIRYSTRLYDNVYECDSIRSPFVIGIVSPKIYLPFRLNEMERQCILAHERFHIRRKDYLIKSFAYLLANVYWFHPLVWIAYRLMCIDMEMSCDEKVISEFTLDLRKEYSRLLLAFAANKRQFPASPLAFGEENTMKRIKNILNYKKTAQWKLIGGVAVLMLTMAACATDASMDEAIAPVLDMTLELKNPEIHDTDSHDREEQIYHFIEHHQAQWAENSQFDMEFYSLDYADSDRIVFHISSGLFEYDLKSQKLTNSIDLKALNCQAVQTGGECGISVYQDSDHQLRAVIKPYPYSDEESYVYDLQSDELFAYDPSLLDDYTLFDGFVSKYDSAVSEVMRTWRAAENVLPLEGNSYGALYWGPGPDLANLCYEAGEQKWEIFHKEQATLPKLLKQDDSFYQSFSLYSSREIGQCLIDYEAFYNMHDYAGVCALSTGLEYSDELWLEFSERTDCLSGGEGSSCSEDEKEYLFEFTCSDESGENGQKVYLKFKYLEGEGWRAEGLPTIRDNG
ncbi:MAG: M56 family metallopeptidase [Lachnospiraceae bacterium]|nr:M56 family metallopeptidase [Lachnospiraceae bacterium]